MFLTALLKKIVEINNIINKLGSVKPKVNMSIIKDTLKNSENINQNLIESPHLPQSKLFLKILGLLYYLENTNKAISPDIILGVLML